MFFLLRAAFWLTLVLVLLPTGQQQPSKPGPQVAAVDAVTAAGAAVSDVSGFCDRQAEACVVGTQAAIAIGQRAQAGARMVLDFLSDRIARGDAPSVPPGAIPSGPRVIPAAASAQSASQNTLQPSDMVPEWRSPPIPRPVSPQRNASPRRDGRPA